jgi:hypothetical protein
VSVEAASITPEMEASIQAHQGDLLMLVPEPKPKKPEPEPTSEEPADPEFLAELDALDPEEDSGLDEAIRNWRKSGFGDGRWAWHGCLLAGYRKVVYNGHVKGGLTPSVRESL